jgi:hypothetical protein
VLPISKPSKILALSFVALMLLTGAFIRPVSALPPTNPAPTFSLTGTPALEGPTFALVHDGGLWVSDYESGQIYEYAPPFSANEAPTVTLSAFEVQDITFDGAGNLWAGTWDEDVYEFAGPTITNGELPSVTLSGLDEPTGVVVSGGSLWVTDYEAYAIYEYTPIPTSNSATPPTPMLTDADGLEAPVQSVFDGAGNLWVANYDAGNVVEYQAPITMGETPTLTLATTNYPVSLTFDSSGDLWVGSPYNLPETAGQIAEFPAPITNGETDTVQVTDSSTDSIWGISIDGSGNIWAADYENEAVYEFSGLVPAIPSSLPPVIPTTLQFAFNSFSGTPPAPMTGELVGVEGPGILYNLPGYQPEAGIAPYVISACSIPSQDLVRVNGFMDYQAGFNSTEILVLNYFNILNNAQGWPAEPICSS